MRNRTRWGTAAIAGLVAVGLAACGSSDGGSDDDGGGEPLRVALVTPESGPLSVFGADAVRGWELAAEQVNAEGGVDGHRVELVKIGTDTSPPKTVRAVERAVRQEGAHYVSGIFTSPENGAVQQRLGALNAININAIAQDDALTGENCSANAIRVVQSSAMNAATIAATLDVLPAKRWAVIAADYNTGHAAAKGFRKAAEATGGKVVVEQFPPLGATEYGSYISRLKKADADGLFMYVIGADAPAFINQGAQFELFDGYDAVLGQNVVSEPLFEALGDKVAGFYNNLGYERNLDHPRNAAFVEAYERKYGSSPYYVPADNYVGAQALFAAVRAAGSVDPEKVKQVLGGLRFEGLDGEITVRPEDHQGNRRNYLGQVVERDGKLGWKIVAEVEPEKIVPAVDPACRK